MRIYRAGFKKKVRKYFLGQLMVFPVYLLEPENATSSTD